jgi:hypothetical protein
MFKKILLVFLFLSLSNGALPVDFMPVDELRPGMKGVGKTVFSGAEVEDFEVQIIGVLKNARPKSDLILLKLGGGPLEESGVITGMSGSPIYIDGKLVGALAYALGTFPKEPVAAAVPIEEMVKSQGCGTADIGFERSQKYGDIIPIATPVVFSGFEPQAREWLAQRLHGFGLTPVAGGGSGETNPGPLVPGSVISVKFVDGDLDMSAFGTVTYLDGDRFYALGHPLFHLGAIELPVGGGYVHTIYKSSMSSNKIVSSTGPVGALLQDRASGVSGSLGATAGMMPLEISVDCGGKTAKYSVRVMLHELLTPLLAAGTVMNCVSSLGALAGESTLKCDFRMSLKGHDPVDVQYAYSDSFAVRTMAMDFMGLLAAVMGNGFEKVSFESVEVSLSMVDKRKTATIVEAFLNKTKVKPGDAVVVTMRMRPNLAEEYTRSIELMIPPDMHPGEIRITVADGSSQSMRELFADPYAANPRRLDEILESLRLVRSPNSIVIKMFRPGRGISVSGGSMPSVPLSFLSVVGKSQPERVRGDPDSPFFEKVIETEEVIRGLVDLEVEVEGK